MLIRKCEIKIKFSFSYNEISQHDFMCLENVCSAVA